MFPGFWQFFWDTLFEGWFRCKDFPRLINKGPFPVGEIFHCLLSSPTLLLSCSEQHFSNTESKASANE